MKKSHIYRVDLRPIRCYLFQLLINTALKSSPGPQIQYETVFSLSDQIVHFGRQLLKRSFSHYASAILAFILAGTAQTASAALIDTLGHAPKIMALGDSITAGCCDPHVGYYQYLANVLTTAGYQFSMVGSVHVGGYNIEAHPGAWPKDLVNGILDPNSDLRSGGIATWMEQSTPDIVLLHAGTNGIMPSTLSYDPTTAQWGSQVADMRSVLDGIFSANTDVYVMLAKIISLRTPSPGTTEYNRQLALMASTYGNSHLSLVDMEDNLSGDPQTNYVDDVHPSADGLKIMADSWYSALKSILDETISNAPIPLTLNIEKLTNGMQADDENDPDVPRLAQGETVTWTYLVTNIGEIEVSEAEIIVTDSQPGINPALDPATDAGGNTILSPGETWIYTASAQALDLETPLEGITVVPGCNDGRSTYQNAGIVVIVGNDVSDEDLSHYCNLGVTDNPALDGNGDGISDPIAHGGSAGGGCTINTRGNSDLTLLFLLFIACKMYQRRNSGSGCFTGKKAA